MLILKLKEWTKEQWKITSTLLFLGDIANIEWKNYFIFYNFNSIGKAKFILIYTATHGKGCHFMVGNGSDLKLFNNFWFIKL